MNVLQFVVLAVVGFVACAEFGSYAFIHPVIRRLPPQHHIRAEQGLLLTFGRVMPIGMPLCLVLAVTYAITARGPAAALGWVAVAALAVAVASTVAVNVGINRATGTWDPDNPPPDWQATRRRWERFQEFRSWLLLAGFVLLCASVASA